MKLERIELFPIPIWRSRIPEFEPHAASMEAWIVEEWKQGSFRKGAYGYGYQSPNRLFTPDVLQGSPEMQVLKQAFMDRVNAILKQRVNQSVKHPPEVYAVTAWVLVQTAEEWVNGPWHDHFPAVVSGCYYLKMPKTETEAEGALAFMRPGTPDAFMNLLDYIKPEQGDFILFPSNLMHRPIPTPSATEMRISINMDAYVHWGHRNEEGKPEADADTWLRRVQDSLDRPFNP